MPSQCLKCAGHNRLQMKKNMLFVRSRGSKTSTPVNSASRLGLHEVVDDRIEEYAADADATTDQLQRVEALPEDDSDAHDDDDALRGVSNRLGDRVRLLDGHCRELVVGVEPQARGDHVPQDDVAGPSGPPCPSASCSRSP